MLLLALGKQPCKDAPAYLLGLMAAVPEDKMPAELRNKHIVAAEPDKSSVFADGDGGRCFLCVGRYDDGFRRLNRMRVVGRWGGRCAFLTENLAP
ncbi:MAG: hypothetical protein AAB699_02585 [Patescibacteria group bacterium]